MVGNSAGFDQLVDNYNVLTPFNSPATSVSGTKKNPDLKPENTKSIEGGLEMYFFGRRLGFDLAFTTPIHMTRSYRCQFPLQPDIPTR